MKIFAVYDTNILVSGLLRKTVYRPIGSIPTRYLPIRTMWFSMKLPCPKRMHSWLQVTPSTSLPK